MKFEISFKSSVYKDLKKIDKNQAAINLDKIENELSEKADTHPQLSEKFPGLRKYRVGDYRVIYTIMNDTILILRIAHRKDANK